MKERLLGVILGVLLGIVIGILIMHIPKIRYDLNGNGKVDIADFIKYHNYYKNH